MTELESDMLLKGDDIYYSVYCVAINYALQKSWLFPAENSDNDDWRV